MSFLKAQWRKLAVANYTIDPKILQPFVPPGTELDTWEDRCYVSLVAFMFIDTRVLGIKVPFHINFEEVNLRFYVKRFEYGEWKRGVVFIKEIVPKHAITFVANTVYKENYQTLPMEHQWDENDTTRTISYQWQKNDHWNSIRVVAEKESTALETGSETEFITEHYWGYAKVDDTTSNEYEVTHPRWQTYKIQSYELDVDFGAVYGSEFAFLNGRQPDSVMLAEGSEITVEKKRTIH